MGSQKTTVNVPLNVCEWVPPEALCGWVEEELAKLSGSGGLSPVHKRLLAILAFAYARGIVSSAEILSVCGTEPLFSSLQQDVDFSLGDMLDVRHEHRAMLVNLVLRLLARAVSQKFGAAPAALEPELKRRLQENAVERIDDGIILDRSQE